MPSAPAGSERAAQLARQRVAAERALRRRERESDPLRSGLRRSVLIETVVAVVLLVVATALSTTEPARTEEAVQASAAGSRTPAAAGPVSLTVPFDTGGPHGRGTAHLALDPARTGAPNTVHLTLTGPSGASMDVPEVRVALTQKAKRLGPLPVDVSRIDQGHWAAAGVQLPVPGTWQLALTVRTSDIDEITEYRNVQVS